MSLRNSIESQAQKYIQNEQYDKVQAMIDDLDYEYESTLLKAHSEASKQTIDLFEIQKLTRELHELQQYQKILINLLG